MATMEAARATGIDSDQESDASPVGPTPMEASPFRSTGSCSTPNTDLFPSKGPGLGRRIPSKGRASWATQKVAELTQEEKVSVPLSSV